MPDTTTLYEQDWYAWTQDQAARLRELGASLRPNGLDIENLAEEVESMGASQRREIRSFLEQIFIHLLKMQFHPAQQARLHWQSEIDAFRSQIEIGLDDSPSLRPRLPELAAPAWRLAFSYVSRRVAAEAPEMLERMKEAGVARDVMPYDLMREVLDRHWYPEPRPE